MSDAVVQEWLEEYRAQLELIPSIFEQLDLAPDGSTAKLPPLVDHTAFAQTLQMRNPVKITMLVRDPYRTRTLDADNSDNSIASYRLSFVVDGLIFEEDEDEDEDEEYELPQDVETPFYIVHVTACGRQVPCVPLPIVPAKRT